MSRTLQVVCSFTADLLIDRLRRELSAQGGGVTVEAAHYGQVAESPADPLGPLGPGHVAGHRVVTVVVRPDDALRRLGPDGDPGYAPAPTADAWLDAVAHGIEVQRGWGADVHLCLTPSGPPVLAEPDLDRWARRAAERLRDRAIAAGATVVPAPADGRWDPRLDTLAHIPYRPAWLAALAVMLARSAHRALVPPVKVLALDCDDTLWGGACAELGPSGVDVGPPWRAVQELAAGQAAAGRLVCLVSHNAEADVMRVLDSGRTRLSRADVVAHRIGWRPKPELLAELADELGLALESFVFVDDNPVQRSAVRAALPDVTVPEFGTVQELPAVLAGLWGLAAEAETDEDRHRTRRYAQERDRRTLRARAGDHAAFLRELRVRADVTPLDAGGLARARQLLERVTQFRCVAPGFESVSVAPGRNSWRVEVTDRLGDYGFVGFVAAGPRDAVFTVDALVLSCRVLGRGVEELLVAHLRRQADVAGCRAIRLTTPCTDRNEPLRNFLTRVDGVQVRRDGDLLTAEIPVGPLVPAGHANHVR